MSESESVAAMRAARLEVRAPVAETMRHAAAVDGRLSAGPVGQAVRLGLAAWVMAVDGDDTALMAMAQPDAVYGLMHPFGKPWQVADDPRVTRIEIWDLLANAEPPRLRVIFRFAGRRRFTDPGQADAAAGGEIMFAGMLDLELAGSGSQPWRVSSGSVRTLDDFLGYVFTSRRETAQEYRQRTSSSAVPAAGSAAAGSGPRFRLTAGFAEHDERFGSSVQLEIRQQAAPDRDEAVQLVWPAIERQTAQALGAGDWRPSLNWLDVVELLEEEPGY